MRNRLMIGKRLIGETGNITLMTMILIIAMLLLSMGMARLTKAQYQLAGVHKNTSNNYHLAEAGVELFVESINELMRSSSSEVAKAVQERMVEKLFVAGQEGAGVEFNEKYVSFDNQEGFYISKDWITLQYTNQIYQVILAEYFDKKGISPYETYQPKSIIYASKGEKESQDQLTYITITPYINGGGMNLPSSLSDKEIIDYNYLKSVETLGDYTEAGIKSDYAKILYRKDTKKYKAAMGLIVSVVIIHENGQVYSKEDLVATIGFEDLQKVDYKILEKYEWLGRAPELLDSGITCFQEVQIEKGACLEVEGDIRVKGNIVVNGGSLETMSLGSKRENESQNTGSIFTLGGLQISGKSGSHIRAMGSVVADEVRITHAANEIGREQNIRIGGHLFVQDDVRINTGVENSSIEVEGVIIGISDTDLDAIGEKNPNKSSGIFNLGGPGTLISMQGAYVAGQPFINYEDETGYHRLYESIGEPYSQLQHYPEYQEINGSTDRYITEEEALIRKDKIRIRDEVAIYAPAYVSAIVEGEEGTREYNYGKLTNQEQALKVFYKGGGHVSLSDLTYRKRDAVYDYMILQPEAYYSGNKSLIGKTGMYHKDYKEAPDERYKGVETYMTAMRGMFLGEFEKGEAGILKPKRLEFEDWIDYSKIEQLETIIGTHTGIKIIGKKGSWQQVDVSEWCEGETTQPILVIAKGPVELINSKSTQSRIKGVVIALEDIKVSGELALEGSLILKGDLIMEGNKTKLKVIHQPQLLLSIPFNNKGIEREVLDSLGLLHLEYKKIKEMFNPTRTGGHEKVYYTIPQLRVKKDFDWVVTHVPLRLRVSALKSERK